MIECLVYSYQKCVVCELIGGCSVGKLVVGRASAPDRSPDALTNDYIYCRGEFDPLVQITKREVRRCSNGYRETVKRLRIEVGLDAA